MLYLFRVIFVLVGTDRIAILVDLPKVGGLPMNSIFRTRSFDYRKWRRPCKRRERCIQYTAPRTFHTRKLFSRVAQGSNCGDLFVSTRVILARMLCFALCLSLHLSHLHSALRLLLLLLLLPSLYPPNTTNPCAPQTGLLFGRLAEHSHIFQRHGGPNTDAAKKIVRRIIND